MKIGLVRRGYSSSGGAEKYLQRFANKLKELGHEMVLFTTNAWPGSLWKNGDIVRIESESPVGFAHELREKNPRKYCDYLFSLERVWECDCYRVGDGVHRAWLKRRAIYESVGKRVFRKLNFKHHQLLKLEKRLFTREGAPHLIVNSHMVKRELQEHYAVPQENISLIYNGADPVSIHGEAVVEKRRELNLDEHDLAILFTGTGWERKGLRFAIEAIEKLNHPKVRLLVAGRGDEKAYASPFVTFLGEVHFISTYFQVADLFILPTLYDPFSNACLEALSYGLPVITTTANGCHEIMQQGVHGEILENPAEIDALSLAMDTWLSPERREAAFTANKQLAAQYSVEENVRQTLAVIEREMQ